MSAFSLPTQRCFHDTEPVLPEPKLFSAYAEVFPPQTLPLKPRTPFLCLRRGVSFARRLPLCRRLFSLPTQRCFRSENHLAVRWRLFSAYAEVFLHIACAANQDISFLCLRRGVSSLLDRGNSKTVFSLPTQRCFSAAVIEPLL